MRSGSLEDRGILPFSDRPINVKEYMTLEMSVTLQDFHEPQRLKYAQEMVGKLDANIQYC